MRFQTAFILSSLSAALDLESTSAESYADELIKENRALKHAQRDNYWGETDLEKFTRSARDIEKPTPFEDYMSFFGVALQNLDWRSAKIGGAHDGKIDLH